MMSVVKIAGSVFVITGASSGIGEAIARLAHERGGRIVLAARRADRLAALAAELPGALPVPTDVTDAAQVARLVRAAVDHFGRVDVLVNNAGQGLHLPVTEVALDDVRAVLELNMLAPLALMQAVVPIMRKGGGGAIVNISSGSTRRVLPGVGPYAATKAALNTLSDVARAELARDGIAVSLVVPGVTDTAFHEVLRAGSADVAGVPKCTVEEVAEAVLHVVETGEPEVVVTPHT
jgi:NADP-dependent 3-hydroxy acid dehydrogenase YdfG